MARSRQLPFADPEGSEEIAGTVERITFRNDENGYTVARFNIEPVGFTTITGRFTSINPGEHLTVTNYLLYLKHLTKVLTITGFAPDATRILTIEYVRPTVFSVYFRIPSETTKEYDAATTEQQDWVIIADSTPVFLPLETRDILIRLQMPKQAILGSRSWEFWVAVAESGAQGTIQTELASRWLVTMR